MHLCPRHDRGHQSRGVFVREKVYQRGRRDPRHPRWSTTRTSSRGRSSPRNEVRRSRVIPMNERGELIIDEYENLLNERTKMVAVAHVSNSLGTVNPIKEMVATAHKFGVPVLCRRSPERAAFSGRCAGPRLRLFRFFRTQDVRPDGQRHCLRQTRMARQNAAVSDRRRDDPHGHVSRKRPLLRSRKSSRPERPRSPPGSASARRSITSTRSISKPRPPTSTSCSNTRPSGSPTSRA